MSELDSPQLFCLQSENAAAFLQGELPPPEAERFAAHLEGCYLCREEAQALEETLALFDADRRKARAEEVSEDFQRSTRACFERWARRAAIEPVPKIHPATLLKSRGRLRRRHTALGLLALFLRLIRLRRPALSGAFSPGPARRKPSGRGPRSDFRDRLLDRWPRAAASLCLGASLILLALGLGLRLGGTRAVDEEEGSPIRRAEGLALTWLAAAQEPGGLWNASRWGGDARYDVGLTGLSLLACLGSVRGEERLPEAAEKAVQALLERQSPEGLFGREFFASPYNHGIATVALLEAWGVRSGGDAHLREPIDRALRWIRSQQSSAGGWGYLGGAGEPNTALTFWPLQALLLARGLGFEDLTTSIELGFQWLASVSDRHGRIGYRRPGEFPEGAGVLLASAAFCDALAGGRHRVPEELRRLWQDRLRLAASSGGEPDPGYYGELLLVSAASAHGMSPRLRQGKDALLVRQLRSGGQRGSWDPDDRWGPVGGRIYATAAAAMALQAERRIARLRGWIN